MSLNYLCPDIHCKTPVEFHFLETESLMLKHILTINRMMYHHHILTRDENETINKMYNKQKEETTKGDWYELLMKDFDFIGTEMDEEIIKSTSKQEYKNKIKQQVKEAAFKEFMKIKQNHSKLDETHYTVLEMQPYLQSNQFSAEERKLLFL